MPEVEPAHEAAGAAARRHAEGLRRLVGLSSRLLSGGEPADLAQAVFEALGGHLRAEVFVCLRHEPDAGPVPLIPVVVHGLSSGAGVPLASIVGPMWRLLCVDHDPRHLRNMLAAEDASGPVARAIGLRAYACTPLVAEGHLLGTVGFGTLERDAFEDDEIDLVQTACHQLAMALARWGAERSLRESERRMRDLFEISAAGIAECGPDGRLNEVNGAFCELLGYRRDELLGRSWLEFTHPDDQAKEAALIARCASGEISQYRLEKRYVRKDGRTVLVDATKRFHRGPDGAPDSAVAVVLDASARSEADAALRASEARLRLALDASSTGLWSWDVATNAVDWSPECYRIHGLAPGAFAGHGDAFFELVHPEDRERVDRVAREAVAAGRSYEVEFRILRPGGEIAWVANRAGATYDADGQPVQVMGTITDITARKRAEEAQRESEARYRYALELNPQIPWVADANGGITDFSSRWLELTGLTREQALGDGWAQAPHPEDRPAMQAAWRHAVETGETYDIEHRVQVAGGGYRWMRSWAAPRRDAAGRIVAWYGSTEDIEDRRRAVEALRVSDRRKDEFLATLAHELRNPLAPIRTGLDLLRRLRTDERSDRIQTVMDRQLRHLVRLVDDLLDVSRISRGRIELERQRVRLQQVVEDAVEASRVAFETGGHQLRVDVPAAPVWVDGDQVRLVQVLGNLLQNAAKYTPSGGHVSVSLRVERDQAVLEVADDGAGIAEDMLPHIFDMFVQADRTLHRSAGGLGIGLSLVHLLVTLHGGAVTARSPGLERGSTFAIHLPLADATTDAAAVNSGEWVAPETLRVLVVDDNVDGADSLVKLVDELGHQARAAYDGASAIALATEFAPRVIFMDLGMPGVDGYETARRLRADPRTASAVFVAVTGWGGEVEQAQTASAGFDLHLTKPVEARTIARLLALAGRYSATPTSRS